MAVRLFNSLTRNKEELKPLHEDHVGLYTCGPTVYWYQHLGNMRAFVLWDLLSRSLSYLGFNVKHVINITDVGHLTDDADDGEDKMEVAAKREGKDVWAIAEHYTQAFKDDIAALNVRDPAIWCKATDHIEQQIAMIKQMEDNGFTYTTSDGVYFDTSKLDDYGKLIPNFDPESLQAGKRVNLGEKRNKTDFALWKLSNSEEKRAMEWDSPWGRGFPGWHIECTAMGCEYLGNTFDIHTGGEEHIPVHHTNEIAQAQGAFGHDHVNIWMHNGWLLFGEEKVSKSSGHILRVKDLVEKGYNPMDFRYFLLQAQYRRPQSFSFDALDAAKTARERLMDKIVTLKEQATLGGEMSKERLAFQAQFITHLEDDMDIPGALAILHDMLKSNLSADEKLSLALDWDQVFGLGLKAAHKEQVIIPDEVQALVDQREQARKDKDWAKADELRDAIAQKGFSISDGPDGPELSALRE